MQADASIPDVWQADVQQHQWRYDAESRHSAILDKLRKTRDDPTTTSQCRCSVPSAPSAATLSDEATHAARYGRSEDSKVAALGVAQAAAYERNSERNCERNCERNGTARQAQAEAAMRAGTEAAIFAELDVVLRHAFRDACAAAEAVGARRCVSAAKEEAMAVLRRQKAAVAAVAEEEEVVAAVVAAQREKKVAFVAAEADAAAAEETIWEQARAWHAEAVREAVEHAVSLTLAGANGEEAIAEAVAADDTRAQLFHERHLKSSMHSAEATPRAASTAEQAAAASAERTVATSAGAESAQGDALELARAGVEATVEATEGGVQRRPRTAAQESRLAGEKQFASAEQEIAGMGVVAQALATAVPDAETKAAAAALRDAIDAEEAVETKQAASASMTFVEACQVLCCSVDAALRLVEAQEAASCERVCQEVFHEADPEKWPILERGDFKEGYAAASRRLADPSCSPAGRVRVPTAGMGVVEQRVKAELGLTHWEEASTARVDALELGARIVRTAAEAIGDALLEMSAKAQAAHADVVSCAVRTALWRQRRASSIMHRQIQAEGDVAVLRALARARREAEADCATQLAHERERCLGEQFDARAEAAVRTEGVSRQHAGEWASASADSLAVPQQSIRVATAPGEESRQLLKRALSTHLAEPRALSAEAAILEAESCQAQQMLPKRTVIDAAAAAELRDIDDAASASNGWAGRHADSSNPGADCKNTAKNYERRSGEKDAFGVSEESLLWTPQTARGRSADSTAAGRNGSHTRRSPPSFSSEALAEHASPLRSTPSSNGATGRSSGLRPVARDVLLRAARAASLGSRIPEQTAAVCSASSTGFLGFHAQAAVAALCVELRQSECERVEERLRIDLLRGEIAEAEGTAMEAAEAAAEAATMAHEAACAAAAAAEAAMAHSAEQGAIEASNGSLSLEGLLCALPRAEAMLLERNLLAIAHSVGLELNSADAAQSQRLHSTDAARQRRDQTRDQQRQRALLLDRSRAQHHHMGQRETCRQNQQLPRHYEHQHDHQHQLLPPASAPALRGSGSGKRGGARAHHEKHGNSLHGRQQLSDNPAFSRLAGRTAFSGSTATVRPPQ